MIFHLQKSFNPIMIPKRLCMAQSFNHHRLFSTREKFMKIDNHGEMQQALMDRQRKFDSAPTNMDVAAKYFRELNRHQKF